ncbi:MAG: hypothetical protein U1B83_04665, partial [Candidatus Cloacimonadaceae bacterium]|nr:hypothetical protein [Candidatus Cloacimonadaceae bacterium]
MKKSVLILLLCLVSILLAQTRQVSLTEASQLAERNARLICEADLGAAEPIPYYGPDDTIIAWHFNFALNKPFPDAEQLKLSCDQAHTAGNRKQGNGDDEYFNIVVGANRDMPVSAQYAKCLSQQYTHGKRLERVAAELFPAGYEIVKTYYLGYANVWHQVRSADTVKYINMLPYPRILSQEEYAAKVGSMTFFWERDDFEEDWVKFLDQRETFDRTGVWIPGEEYMPFYEWSYG